MEPSDPKPSTSGTHEQLNTEYDDIFDISSEFSDEDEEQITQKRTKKG